MKKLREMLFGVRAEATGSRKSLATSAFVGDEYAQTFEDYDNGQTITIIGYKPNQWKTYLSYVGIVLSLGFLRLMFHWFPKFWMQTTHDIEKLINCPRVLIEDNYKNKWKTYETTAVDLLKLSDGSKQVYYLKDNNLKENSAIKSFTYKSLRYVLDGDHFAKLDGIADGQAQNQLHDMTGVPENKKSSRLNVYGPNEIRVPLTSVFQLVLLEVLTPFYVFQIASIAIWITEGYVYFVIVIMSLTIAGVISHVYQTRKNQKNLRSQVKLKDKVDILRNGSAMRACSTELVPGDLVVLREGYVFCDAILLQGNCLVDESMLTGESIQVLKTPLPNNSNVYRAEDSSAHQLFAGTRIVQANGELHVLVTHTGFLTSKGSLVRSIMYPPPVDYAFDRDSTKYCFIMFAVGFLFAIYIAYAKATRGIPMGDLIIKTLDSITILLPAALPATMIVGKLHALRNLKKVQIFCTNSKVLNVSGAVNVVCLDKTGTITEDRLDFIGVLHGNTAEVINSDFGPELVRGMSCCHNLAVYQGELQGDPLEVQMIEAVNSGLNPDDVNEVLMGSGESISIRIVERFQFSSNLRRMGVIVQNSDTGSYEVFCKGSPEIIKSLCSNTDQVNDEAFERLTKQGLRVLAIAHKPLAAEDSPRGIPRDHVENDLVFLGYLVFENKVKAGSKEIIAELHKGNLEVKMITGDNIETAVSVAKECGILSMHPRILTNLDHFEQLQTPQGLSAFKSVIKNMDYLAMTGNVWQGILAKDEGLIRQLLPRTQVFARMASNQKQQVIEQLQALHYNVCMCGDGTNDCSALKAANVGISLTESESSIASPLTSKVPNISAVLEVIREGRAALVTTVLIVKIILAGNAIQYVGLLILYEIDASFSDPQFLYLDFHMLLYGFFIGYVNAHPGSLSPRQPTSTLLSVKPILSLFGYLLPTIFFQFLAMSLLREQKWFVPYEHKPEEGNNFLSYENCVIFIVCLFQYTCMGVVFSKGSPYRRPMWTNWLLCSCMAVFVVINVSLTLTHWEWLSGFFDVLPPPMDDFRWVLCVLGIVHLLTTLIIEEVFVERLIGRYLMEKINGKQRQTQAKARQKDFALV